jgi:hypothetical protein
MAQRRTESRLALVALRVNGLICVPDDHLCLAIIPAVPVHTIVSWDFALPSVRDGPQPFWAVFRSWALQSGIVVAWLSFSRVPR